MKVEIDRKVNPNLELYKKEDMDIAYTFTKDLHKELGKFIKGVVLFGRNNFPSLSFILRGCL